jgi:hypothetical protein
VYGLKQVVQVVTVVTRLFLQGNFCHHLVTTVTTSMVSFRGIADSTLLESDANDPRLIREAVAFELGNPR